MTSCISLDLPPRFRLAQLPSELLTIVLTYLPLSCKFRSLTRVSHDFPTLTASAFQYDHLDLSGDSLALLSSGNTVHRVALFSQLRSAAFIRHSITDHSGSQVYRILSSSSLDAARPFSALRALCLTIPEIGNTYFVFAKDRDLLLSALCSFATSLPQLHTLFFASSLLRLGVGERPGDSVFVSSDWLARLPSLRHLTLAVGLEAPVLFRLFALPLLSLDLQHCRSDSNITGRDGGIDLEAALESVSGTLRRLYLPPHAHQPYLITYVGSLLIRYAERTQSLEQQTDVSRTWRLEHLHFPPLSSKMSYQLALGIPSLTALHLSAFFDREQLCTFFSVASPACLPHLRRLTAPVTDPESRRQDEANIHQSCIAFFPAYAHQLQHLTLMHLPSSARSCELLFASVLSCSRLVSLKLISDVAVGHLIVLPARVLSMPLLQKLCIHAVAHRSGRVAHLQHADMVRLLAACPALLDLSLTLPNASVNLLPAIARSCRQLRILRIRSDDNTLWELNEELMSAASTLLPGGAFASLHALYIDYHLTAGQTAPQPTAPLLRALSSLLCHAPIRRLCLLAHMDVTHIPFYANFPFLTRLRLHSPQLRTILQHYCTPSSSASTITQRSDANQRIDSWLWRTRRASMRNGDEADRWEECETEDDEQVEEDDWLACPAFVGERVFVGAGGCMLSGREAWLEKGQVVAAAEKERRRLAALEKARVAVEERAKQLRKEVAKSTKTKKKKGSEEVVSAADAFLAVSGIKRKR